MTGPRTLKEIKLRGAVGSDYGALRNFKAGDTWYQREVTKLVKRLARMLRDESVEEHFTASAYLNEGGEIVAVTAFDRHDEETAELLLLVLDSPFQGSILSESDPGGQLGGVVGELGDAFVEAGEEGIVGGSGEVALAGPFEQDRQLPDREAAVPG